MSESEFNNYSEVIHERDKLKEQNEKLKEKIRQIEAWLSFNTHPDKDQIRVFRNSMIELLKSCE